MRQLVIVCDFPHVEKIRLAVAAFGHPQAIGSLVDIYPVDIGVAGDHRRVKHEILNLLQDKGISYGLTDQPLLCATREAGSGLGLAQLARQMGYDYKPVNTRAMCEINSPSHGKPVVARLLNECGLSLRAFSASLLGHWAHNRINRPWIDNWVFQFSQLANLHWLGEEILRNIQMVDLARLGGMLVGLRPGDDAAMCVNRDPRGTGKSAEIIANLLKKQTLDDIYDSPSSAIDTKGHRKIVLFEDGLWSGTEAIGILQSLLGLREEGRCKTPKLRDPAILKSIDMTLAYGVATDYGESLVQRFLVAEGLTEVKIVATEKIKIANESLIDSIEKGELETGVLWEEGPPPELIIPYVSERIAQNRQLTADQHQVADLFCREIGQQLFGNYLKSMQKLHGWSPWSPEKLKKCGLGMHGLGLLHAFEHSVPKATSPLLWGSGEVHWNGKKLDWQPLFMHAAESV